MKAVGFSEFGGPEVLKYIDLAQPQPGSQEVVIQNHTLGVNFADIYRRKGQFQSEPPSPFVAGHEGAGIIHSVGEGVKEFSVGDRVAFAHVPRSNAEFIKAPAWKVISLPDDISFESAAGILLQGLTAHYLTHDSYKVRAGDTVLIHSASGGVGLLLTQICKMIGARTIGTVSTEDKVLVAKAAGCDHVIVRSAGDWKKKILEMTDGLGVNASYDAIGTTLAETLHVTAPKGTVIYFGWAGGSTPKIDPLLLMEESKTLVGGELWGHIADRNSLLERSHTLFSWLREGKIKSQIFKTYHLSEAADAHQVLESGKTTGKILLKIDSLYPPL